MTISPQSGAYEEGFELTTSGISNILHEYTVLANAYAKWLLRKFDIRVPELKGAAKMTAHPFAGSNKSALSSLCKEASMRILSSSNIEGSYEGSCRKESRP